MVKTGKNSAVDVNLSNLITQKKNGHSITLLTGQ
jgi:hypothetical protein